MTSLHTPARKTRKYRWMMRRDVCFVAVVAAAIAIYHGYGHVTGPGRITDGLHAALDRKPKRVNIVITAKFPPEAFHMGVFQEFGSMRGTEGRRATLFRVRPADVVRLSRFYWVENIDLVGR